jgi:hypothetical protein
MIGCVSIVLRFNALAEFASDYFMAELRYVRLGGHELHTSEKIES